MDQCISNNCGSNQCGGNSRGRKITIIIKPTNQCNLRCKHCYHAEKGYDGEPMTYEILEKAMTSVLPYYDSVTYLWHGGEPLLMPLSFYDKVFELQQKYRRDDKQEIYNLMQSNGTLITEEVAEYLVKHDIRIGISFDGPYNDEIRGLTEKTLAGYENMNKIGLKKGALACIGSHNIGKLDEIYDYFKEKGMGVKLAPIFESGSAKVNDNLLMDKYKYINAMCRLFDRWLRDDQCNIGVVPFEEDVKTILFNKEKVCVHNNCTYKWISIDNKGHLYPCGRAYTKEYCFGNVMQFDDIHKAFETEAYQSIVKKSNIRRKKCKETCNVFRYCEGGCNNDAIIENGLENISDFACNTYRAILIHERNRLNEAKYELLYNRKPPKRDEKCQPNSESQVNESNLPEGENAMLQNQPDIREQVSSMKINPFVRREIIGALAELRF